MGRFFSPCLFSFLPSSLPFFFSPVFRPAPSTSIKIRPVSRDVDAFSEAGWALPVHGQVNVGGARWGGGGRDRSRCKTRLKFCPRPRRYHCPKAAQKFAFRRITIVLCCSPLPSSSFPSTATAVTVVVVVVASSFFLLFLYLSFIFLTLFLSLPSLLLSNMCVCECILLRRLLTLVCFHAL